jgi:hypothetical protein
LVRHRRIWSGWLIGHLAHALGIENVGFNLGFGALGRDLLAIPQKADASGVADSGNDLAAGADGGVRRRDESFLADRLAIGGDGDPGSLGRADHEL